MSKEREAWAYAKDTLRLEGQEVSPEVEGAAQRVICGELTWDEVVKQVLTAKQVR